ncbi:chemotaxis protein CheW [Melittangium boletus]|uniref:Positive regulator of CheA protein activity (CheW) n=1 Tax=Melittangium boletus DSM 14713 TaxID=1294270 RepID=A0A250IPP0_9BACT|nr:chemotaxis protein CheW [Melittangium boletus]ATB32906.1 Positive regulator of CheA protein activity (CheW) [Melittangium boletus DSM 14713]
MSNTIEESSAATQYLSFILAGQEYALGILRVKEIIEYDTVTPVPGAPVWVRGVFNLRGSVVPVVDLTIKLGLPPATLTRRSCIVVVEVRLGGEEIVLGLLADAIGQVIDLGPEDVAAPPAFGTPVHADYLVGMGRVAASRHFVLLLDIDKVLSTQEIVLATAAPPPEVPQKGMPGVET